VLDVVRGCVQGQGNLVEGTPSSRLWCEPNRPTSSQLLQSSFIDADHASDCACRATLCVEEVIDVATGEYSSDDEPASMTSIINSVTKSIRKVCQSIVGVNAYIVHKHPSLAEP
jgi:hypothetical protein